MAEVSERVSYRWRGPLSDGEMTELVAADGGVVAAGAWGRVRRHSLGWIVARDEGGRAVGFVNVAWDGGAHAFVLDTRTHADVRRRGIGTELVRRAALHAAEAGCEWLHVDFEPHLRRFYFDACGFWPTEAGLLRLRDG